MNIHIIPTDRPSILFIDNDDKKLRLYKKPMVSEYALNQNIYITSYEEIKEVDYVITPTNDIIQWTKVFQPIGKKIIITTDKSLINEGIQSIDDEFLQWFVKNPSCEEVEVKKEKVILGEVVGTTYIDFKYKIMPKKETLEDVKDLNYWRINAEEDYLKVPISVLRYISELEKQDSNALYNDEEVLRLITSFKKYLSFSDEIDEIKWFEKCKKK